MKTWNTPQIKELDIEKTATTVISNPFSIASGTQAGVGSSDNDSPIFGGYSGYSGYSGHSGRR